MIDSRLIDERYLKFYMKLVEMADEYSYFIFISRKCYFYTKIIQEHQKEEDRIPYHKLNVHELRDRDILKEMDFSIFEHGKKVLLIDDTLYTGKTLLRIVERIRDKVLNPNISIAVFAMTPKALTYFFDKSDFQGYKRMFAEVFTYSQMSEFVIKELQAIQESRHSYVIDLPVFKEVQICPEAFEKLINEKNAGWVFTDYKVKIKDISFDNGFFIYDNKYLKNVMGEALLSLVIKCRYEKKENEHGESKVFCRFTPFAMLRSVEYKECWKYFISLFQETPFLDYIYKKNSDEKDDEDYITLYRSIVYALSYFIGKVFQDYAEVITGTRMELYKNLSPIGFNEVFSKSIDEIFNNFSISKFYIRLPRPQGEYNSSGEKIYFDMPKIESWFMGWLAIQKRDHLISNENCNTSSAIVTLETIESLLKENCSFLNASQFQKSLICIILKALDTGVLSNSVIKDGDRIVRCFKLGESSDILSEHDFTVFYAAVYAYYNCSKMVSEKYKKQYGKFIKSLEAYLLENNYFKNKYISTEAFQYFSQYFDMEGEVLQRELANKRYVLCKNLNKEKKYIRDVMDFIYRQNYFQ